MSSVLVTKRPEISKTAPDLARPRWTRTRESAFGELALSPPAGTLSPPCCPPQPVRILRILPLTWRGLHIWPRPGGMRAVEGGVHGLARVSA